MCSAMRLYCLNSPALSFGKGFSSPVVVAPPAASLFIGEHGGSDAADVEDIIAGSVFCSHGVVGMNVLVDVGKNEYLVGRLVRLNMLKRKCFMRKEKVAMTTDADTKIHSLGYLIFLILEGKPLAALEGWPNTTITNHGWCSFRRSDLGSRLRT